MTLERTFNKDEFIISLLKEIKEKQNLQQKQSAWILSKLKMQDEKNGFSFGQNPEIQVP
jgi:hypothetical protein